MRKEFEINFGKVSKWMDDLLKDFEQGIGIDGNKPTKENCKQKEKVCQTQNYPLVNFYSDEDQYMMDVIAPYTKKEEIDIDIDKDGQGNNIITVSSSNKGAFKQPKMMGSIDWLRSEMKPHSFKRTFKINKDVKINKITAKHENGVLYIFMPKAKKKNEEKRNIIIK